MEVNRDSHCDTAIGEYSIHKRYRTKFAMSVNISPEIENQATQLYPQLQNLLY